MAGYDISASVSSSAAANIGGDFTVGGGKSDKQDIYKYVIFAVVGLVALMFFMRR